MLKIRATKAPPVPKTKRAVSPLTHHEILAFIGPFTERDRHLDMAASQRAERRIAFKAIERPAPAAGLPALLEDLELIVSERDSFRLIQTLTPLDEVGADSARSATLSAAGKDLGVMLDQIERFPAARHFCIYDGIRVRRSYWLEQNKPSSDEDTAGWHPVLVSAKAEIHGVSFELDANRVAGLPAKIRLTAPAGQQLKVPVDLLAVMGRHWRALGDYMSHWRGTIRVAKREPKRVQDIEDKLGRTVRHLAATLSRPPAEFHNRHRAQRWRAALQRGMPLLVALGLIVGTPFIARAPLQDGGSMLQLLVFHAPPLMLIAFFLGFNEVPDLVLPRIPRELKQDGWFAPRA